MFDLKFMISLRLSASLPCIILLYHLVSQRFRIYCKFVNLRFNPKEEAHCLNYEPIVLLKTCFNNLFYPVTAIQRIL